MESLVKFLRTTDYLVVKAPNPDTSTYPGDWKILLSSPHTWSVLLAYGETPEGYTDIVGDSSVGPDRDRIIEYILTHKAAVAYRFMQCVFKGE